MKTLLVFILLFASVICASAQDNLSDYLIMQDIAQYKFFKGWLFQGGLVGAPRATKIGDNEEGFYTAYICGYDGGNNYSAPNVEVRVYDSTQWLLHNIEGKLRIKNIENEKLGFLTGSSAIKQFGQYKVYYLGAGTRYYFWLHDNLAIFISAHGITNPEPVEVVQAYLEKWPPTQPNDSTKLITGTEQWIKDEMERFLWVSGRWFAEYDAGKETLSDVKQEVVENLDDFLSYRGKFFNENVDQERVAVQNADIATLRAKLTEYQQWWLDNKSNTLSGF